MKPLLIIAVTILAVGCGEKNEPVAVTKPELEGVSVEELETREFLVYVKGSAVLYTGKSYELYPNGELEEVYTFKDGIPHGLMTKWYMNGQKEAEVNFKIGQPDGLVVEWHENGQKKKEVNFKDGKAVEGSEKLWNNKSEQVDSYKESFLKTKGKENISEGVTFTKLERRKGLIYLKGANTPYTGKAFEFYLRVEQKKIEANYKNGIKDGVETVWHENGQKMSEEKFKDGEIVKGSQKYWNSKGKAGSIFSTLE